MSKLMHLVDQLVEQGIEVTIRKPFKPLPANFAGTNNRVYDLNAGTKSGMYLVEDAVGDVYVLGRYDECEQVACVVELLWIFASRYRARGFGSPVWLDLAVKAGTLEKVENVEVNYV